MFNQRNDAVYVIILALCWSGSTTVPVSEFYSFGAASGDSSLSPNDDGSSEEILISSFFPFFNHQHDRLYVNNNGGISFLVPVSEFTPDAFPLGNDRRLITPFWADVNTNVCGKVWYRGTVNRDILSKATQDVKTYGPINMENFRATWAFIATWENVCFYGASGTGKQKKNTFQAVLITNGRHSFAMFNYDKIQWTTGTASDGDSNTGLGGTPAQAGFNAGDGVIYYTVDGSRTGRILNLASMTNINVPGKFLFRVDMETIEDGGCNTAGSLTITPRFGNMLGGHHVRVSGPCFKQISETDKKPVATLIFGKDKDERNDCFQVDNHTVECVVPTSLFKVGHLKVELKTSDEGDGNKTFIGYYSPENPMRYEPQIKRVNPKQWKYGADRLELSWDPVKVQRSLKCSGSNSGRIDLLVYKEPDIGIPKWIQAWLTTNDLVDLQSGKHVFTLTENEWKDISSIWRQDTRGLGNTGVFRIGCNNAYDSSLPTGSQQKRSASVSFDDIVRTTSAVWSDIHDLFWISKVTPKEAALFCDMWQAGETAVNNTTPCPCTLDQALIDMGRFHADPLCHQGICEGYPDAFHCVHSNTQGGTGHGQRCCYYSRDKPGVGGELIRDTPEAIRWDGETYARLPGRSSRYHYQGVAPHKAKGKVPYLSNFLGDEVPYRYCCKYNRGDDVKYQRIQCERYAALRPASDCTDYVPPIPAGGIGDPHITTLDGFKYTFNGIGEYTLIETLNNSFVLQARTVQVKDSNGNLQRASVFGAVVAKTNSSDLIQVQLNEITTTEILINGERQDFEENAFQSFEGIEVASINGSKVIITFPRESIAIVLDAGLGLMNVMVFGPPEMKGSTRGLLGTWNDNMEDDLTFPNGVVLRANSTSRQIHQFGLSWALSEDTSLFKYPTGMTFNNFQNPQFVPQFPEDVLRHVTVEQRALCGNSVECLYDVVTTNNTDLAKMTSVAVNVIEKNIQVTKPVIRCPALMIQNGRVIASGFKINDTAEYTCNTGYLLAGTRSRACQHNGTWTEMESQPICEIVECSSFEIPNANINFTGLVYDDVATIHCLHGYVLLGSANRTCQVTGTWSGDTPRCEVSASSDKWIIVGATLGALLVCIILVVVAVILVRRQHAATIRRLNKSVDINTRDNPIYMDQQQDA